MVLNVDKGPRLEGSGTAVEPDVQVVAYDDVPPEAHAVPIVEPLAEEQPKPPTTSATSHQSAVMADGSDGCDLVLCGDSKVRRLSPGCNLSLSLCGNTFVDLMDQQFPPGTKISLYNIRFCGNTQLLVPPGTRVVVRRLLLCGNRDIYVEDDPEMMHDPEIVPPKLSVFILSLCGDVRVRSDRNSMEDNWFQRLSNGNFN